MKKWLLIILALSTIIFVTGCGSKKKDNNKESDEPTMNKQTDQAETPNAVKDEITISELKIKNGENTIYGKIYVPHGEGKHPAIILSHGYNGTNNDFVNECKYFAQNGYIAYAFDFCGGSVNSKSTGKSTDMTIFTEKSDLLAVFDHISAMDTVDSEQIFLFGGSQGGLITTLAAEEKANNVKGMILYFPALCVPDDWRKTYPTTENIPDVNNFWGLDLGKNFFVTINDFYVFDNIGSYDKDVLIIHGDKDAIVSIDYSKRAVELYKNAKLITLTGEGHGFSPSGGNIAKKDVLNYLLEHTNR